MLKSLRSCGGFIFFPLLSFPLHHCNVWCEHSQRWFSSETPAQHRNDVYFCSSYRSVPSSHCPTSFWKNATEGRGKAWRERTLSHTGCLSFCLVRNGQENGSNQMKRNGKIKPTKPFHTRPGSSSLTNLRLLFLSRSSFPFSCVTSRMHTVSLVLTACATYLTMMFHNPSTTSSVTVSHFSPPSSQQVFSSRFLVELVSDIQDFGLSRTCCTNSPDPTGLQSCLSTCCVSTCVKREVCVCD